MSEPSPDAPSLYEQMGGRPAFARLVDTLRTLAEEARAPDLAVHGRFLLMGALLERGEVGLVGELLELQQP